MDELPVFRTIPVFALFAPGVKLCSCGYVDGVSASFGGSLMILMVVVIFGTSVLLGRLGRTDAHGRRSKGLSTHGRAARGSGAREAATSFIK